MFAIAVIALLCMILLCVTAPAAGRMVLALALVACYYTVCICLAVAYFAFVIFIMAN